MNTSHVGTEEPHVVCDTDLHDGINESSITLKPQKGDQKSVVEYNHLLYMTLWVTLQRKWKSGITTYYLESLISLNPTTYYNPHTHQTLQFHRLYKIYIIRDMERE